MKRMVALMMCVWACGGGEGSNLVPIVSLSDVGDACRVLSSAWCDAGIECELAGEQERAACEQSVYRWCCADDGVCRQPTDWIEEELVVCVDAIASATCESLDDGYLPLECLE